MEGFRHPKFPPKKRKVFFGLAIFCQEHVQRELMFLGEYLKFHKVDADFADFPHIFSATLNVQQQDLAMI